MDDLPVYIDPLYLRSLVLDIYDGTPGRRVRYHVEGLWKLRYHRLVEASGPRPIPVLTSAGRQLAERYHRA